jgi:hypothetical protein
VAHPLQMLIGGAAQPAAHRRLRAVHPLGDTPESYAFYFVGQRISDDFGGAARGACRAVGNRIWVAPQSRQRTGCGRTVTVAVPSERTVRTRPSPAHPTLAARAPLGAGGVVGAGLLAPANDDHSR